METETTELTAPLEGMQVRRGFPWRKLRAERTDKGLLVEGYAAVFNQEADLGWFRESIRPGAFRKTLKEGDQVALLNHDSTITLGRKSAGTLELNEDSHGLRTRLWLDPEISDQKDTYHRIDRGDIQGMSFGFVPVKEKVQHAKDGEKELRELVEVKLFEVSPVTFPAYEMTEVEARAMQSARGDSGKPPVETAVAEPDHCKGQPGHSKTLADTSEVERILLRLRTV